MAISSTSTTSPLHEPQSKSQFQLHISSQAQTQTQTQTHSQISPNGSVSSVHAATHRMMMKPFINSVNRLFDISQPVKTLVPAPILNIPKHCNDAGDSEHFMTASTLSSTSKAPTIHQHVEQRQKLSRSSVSWIEERVSISSRPSGYELLPATRWHRIYNDSVTHQAYALKKDTGSRLPLLVGDYKFSRLNKPLRILDYSDDEYVNLLRHPDWTREETDILFDLTHQYQMRFIVIHDRFILHFENKIRSEMQENLISSASLKTSNLSLHLQKSEHSPANTAANSNDYMYSTDIGVSRFDSESCPALEADDKHSLTQFNSSSMSPALQSSALKASISKTIEQLKYRFYSIQQELLRYRNSSDPDLPKHPLMAIGYDPGCDMWRKSELGKLLKRSDEQNVEVAKIALEHRALVKEIKALRQTHKLALPPTRALSPPVQRFQPPQARVVKVTQKFKGIAVRQPQISVPTISMNTPSDLITHQSQPQQLADIPDQCWPQTMFGEGFKTSVFLRSSQFNKPLNLNAKLVERLEASLVNLKIQKPNDLTVPTGVVAEMYNKLRYDLVTLFNLEKYVNDRRNQLKSGQYLSMTINKRGAGGIQNEPDAKRRKH